MPFVALLAVERTLNGMDWSLAGPDHLRQVDSLRVIAVAALDFQHRTAAMDRIGDARRRLIRPAEEQASRPQFAIQPVSLGKCPVGSRMRGLRLAGQALILPLGFAEFSGVVPTIAAGEGDMKDSSTLSRSLPIS